MLTSVCLIFEALDITFALVLMIGATCVFNVSHSLATFVISQLFLTKSSLKCSQTFWMASLPKTLQSPLTGQVKVSNMDSIFFKFADFLMSLNICSTFATLEGYCSQTLRVALLKCFKWNP